MALCEREKNQVRTNTIDFVSDSNLTTNHVLITCFFVASVSDTALMCQLL